MAEWISCAERLPAGGETVIVRFSGFWPNRGNGGVTDLYCWDGEWFNVPERVTVTHWVPMPEVRHG